MDKPFKAISLASINASGTSDKALYSALTTGMFFGQKSSLEISVDESILKPYFTVPLSIKDNQDFKIKKQLLLITCLQQTAIKLQQLLSVIPINTIEHLIITTSIFSIYQNNITQSDDTQDGKNSSDIDKCKIEWEHAIKEAVDDYLTAFSHKLVFKYSHTPSVDQQINDCTQAQTFERPILMVNIDSLVDYHHVDFLNTLLDIQCLQGTTGVMPSEAVTSTLLIPAHYPDISHGSLITVQPLNANQQQTIKEQLTQAKFALPSTVLHVGAISESWATYWYGQTNCFYREQPNEVSSEISTALVSKELTLFDQTKTLGYLGVANLTTALASAAALLMSPIESVTEIWVVEHQINHKNTQKLAANVYKVISGSTS